ncbi:MAG TPA: NAD(P)/FAD-dependent oxidoreductase [Chryseolinea sp.]|nr:NAD(P)/FAD-dependent oxidoreductase [Chryseolinea sp.]
MNSQTHIAVVGGGLVGSLMTLYLAKRGYKVSVFERRPDPRLQSSDVGRSINLALSNRGIRSLEEVGLAKVMKESVIPMNGRMMHDVKGKLTFQPYGAAGQFINSISRGELNEVLITAAEDEGIEYFFNHRCINANTAGQELTFQVGESRIRRTFDVILGTDGAFSAVRMAMQLTDRFNFEQEYIEHGYKEFHILPSGKGSLSERNALHIWPRESFMLIALPNPDESFTGTLFFPFEGTPSFSSLTDPDVFQSFFVKTFPDVADQIPDLKSQLITNPTSSLVTIRCFPWSIQRTLLLGDASHAVVPFYGQGMNAGFEDCRILNELLEQHNDNWDTVIPYFQQLRKPDTDAIAKLALDNFVEMRDLVADAEFLLRKKIEAKIHEAFPDRWIPLYSMVTFHDNIRYSEAYRIGQKQKMVMDDVMKIPGIESTWQSLDLRQLLDRMLKD